MSPLHGCVVVGEDVSIVMEVDDKLGFGDDVDDRWWLGCKMGRCALSSVG